MRCIVKTYFKDSRGNWHQPGNQIDLSEKDATKQAELGNVMIDTRMIEQPNTRKRGRPRKRNAFT